MAVQKKLTHYFVLNGMGAAFLRIFGCDCARCLADDPQVNCSASLISVDEAGQTAHHVLFDVGGGVTNQLTRSPFLQGKNAKLDWLCLTHWHPDHVKDINRLLASHVQAAEIIGLEPREKVRLWGRSGTVAWMNQLHGYELQQFCQVQPSNEQRPFGHLLPPVPIGLPDVQIAPITVGHRNADFSPHNAKEPLPCCCGYIVETTATKIVVFWDVDNGNEWIERPLTPEQKTAVSHLKNADHFFVDCTFWKKRDTPKNHASFDDVTRWARVLTPKQTWLMHITGHVEGRGNEGFGWSNAEWDAQAKRRWRAEKLPGDVGVPMAGQTFLMR